MPYVYALTRITLGVLNEKSVFAAFVQDYIIGVIAESVFLGNVISLVPDNTVL